METSPGAQWYGSCYHVYMEPTEVPVHELRAHLSEYLRRAHHGETIHITNHGYPIAALTAVVKPTEEEQAPS